MRQEDKYRKAVKDFQAFSTLHPPKPAGSTDSTTSSDIEEQRDRLRRALQLAKAAARPTTLSYDARSLPPMPLPLKALTMPTIAGDAEESESEVPLAEHDSRAFSSMTPKRPVQIASSPLSPVAASLRSFVFGVVSKR